MATIRALLIIFASTAVAADLPINPVPRRVRSQAAVEWTFDEGDQGWRAQHDCTASQAEGVLRITSVGDDPYLHGKVDVSGGQFVLRMRAKAQTAGNASVYWATDTSSWGEDKSKSFPLRHDGQWREYDVRFSVAGRLMQLRIDPGTAPGEFEIDWIRLVHEELHPLTIEDINVSETACGSAFGTTTPRQSNSWSRIGATTSTVTAA